MMARLSVFLACVSVVVCIYITSASAAATGKNCTRIPPNHVDEECVIVSREDGRCFNYEAGDRLINECYDRSSCHVSAGVMLVISCGEEGSLLELYRDNATFGERNVSWPFVLPSVSGNYECRDSEGGVFVSNRSIIVDEEIYVLPEQYPYEQRCRRDIVPDYIPNYDCNVAERRQSFFFTGDHVLWFNVLGVRPIDVAIEVVWFNHYPVDLHLSYDTEVSNETTLHSVALNSDDLVIVGDETSVIAYIVITASGSSFEPATMCVRLEFNARGPELFLGEDLPMDQTVSAGDSAKFLCQASTLYESTDPQHATVSLSVAAPGAVLTDQCLNCTFTATELFCTEMTNKATTCSGLQFSTKSSGGGASDIQTHNLTASWEEAELMMDGYRVECAIAVNGVIQWLRAATLTVLPTPPVPSITTSATPSISVDVASNSGGGESSQSSLSDGAIAGIVVGCVAVVAVGVMVVVMAGVVLSYRQRHSSKGRRLHNTDEQSENLEKNSG